VSGARFSSVAAGPSTIKKKKNKKYLQFKKALRNLLF